ncbi:MAG: Mur ligase domain-containing protein [Sellimonas intestinalis]
MHFPEREIHGICIDSRECREGTVFVCIRGSLCNGSRYARGGAKAWSEASCGRKRGAGDDRRDFGRIPGV